MSGGGFLTIDEIVRKRYRIVMRRMVVVFVIGFTTITTTAFDTIY